MENIIKKILEPFRTPINPANIITANIPNVTGALAFISG